ncbi:MAG: ThiF family adenylyltransferase [Gammaproteobacteria bacterium]|nr:ThiF family adenylyltransferase [Gammaproteobacteria bacterium]
MFDYGEAFSRNLGWLTPQEQQRLRGARVAVAGMGGVGGVHVQGLARLGVGALNLSDFDSFEIANFNRQAGAAMSTIGQPKVEVMRSFALDVNPETKVRVFPNGLDENNLVDYLDGVDLLIDAIDFFANGLRPALYRAARERGIPVVCSAPLGAGASLICFKPDGMSFDDYFGFACCDDITMAVRFMVGMSPRLPQRHYLAYPEIVDFVKHRVPSLGMACQFAAGMAVTATMKLLLQRGGVKAAPHTEQFDAYLGRFYRCWRPGGYRNPLQKLAERIVISQLKLDRS